MRNSTAAANGTAAMGSAPLSAPALRSPERSPPWTDLARALECTLPGRSAEFCVVRHGQTTLNALGLVSGAADTELTREGRLQSVRVARELAAQDLWFDRAYCSPLQRARETMAIICSAGGWDVVVDVDARLRERGLGELEGRPARPVAAYADGDLDWSPSGGESYRDLARRLFAFLVERLRDPELAGRSVLVCSHVGPMRLLRGMVDREVDPAKVLAAEFPNLSAVSFTGEEICIPAFLGELPSDG